MDMDKEEIIKNKKINLLTNGRLFPSYIMKNFKNFVLSKNNETDDDPCELSINKNVGKFVFLF